MLGIDYIIPNINYLKENQKRIKGIFLTHGHYENSGALMDIVKYLKGITGRKLFEKYPAIRQKLWKGQLWNHSYYVETIGSVSEENIRRYIEHQSKSY